MKLTFTLAASALLAFSTLAQASPLAYVSTWDGAFGTVDLTSGAYTSINAHTGVTYQGLNIVNGSLYAFQVSNRSTGFGVVNASTGNFCEGGACSPSAGDNAAGGGIPGGATMYSVNVVDSAPYTLGIYATNAAARTNSLLANTGLDNCNVNFGKTAIGGSADGSLYFAYGCNLSTSRLYSVNTSTGGLTQLGSTGLAPGQFILAMTFAEGSLYGFVTDQSGPKIYTINTTTGAASFVANFSSNPGGLVVGAASGTVGTPEPATFALMGGALAGIGLLSRRRKTR